ncbi:MAG: hypothetical protein J5517_01540 [Eubacterium sp.]|nr:hypothetical protein [Eubacterium sp.]
MKMTKRKIICVITALLFVVSAVYPNYRAYSEEASKATLTDAIEEATEISEEVTETTTEKDTEAAVVQSDESSSDETELSHQSLEVFPDKKDKEKSVTLEGLMPVDATAKVVDVTDDAEPITSDATPTDAKSADEAEECTVLAAYDISIMDGNSEYQPEENRPISVQINDPQISSDSILHVWHIRDDGTKEEILDITVEDGSVSFDATGFSVYEIVEEPGVNFEAYTWEEVVDLQDLENRLSEGFVLGNSDNGFYLKNEIFRVSNSRTGILKTSPADSLPTGDAAIYYLEAVSGMSHTYYLYCYDNNGVKQYIKQNNNSLLFVDSQSNASGFQVSDYTFTENGVTYTGLAFKSGNYYINQQGMPNGKSFCAYNNNSKDNVITLWYKKYADVNDPFSLSGKTHGLMAYSDGSSSGTALMADPGINYQTMIETTIRPNSGAGKEIYVTENDDVTEWTFESVAEDRYYIYATVNGEKKYLKISSNGVSLTDEPDKNEDNEITVIPGVDEHAHTIMLSTGNYTLAYDGTQFTVITNVTSTSKVWFNFVDKIVVEDDDQLSYSAEKISVSEAVDQQSVIVYTRVWNGSGYDFYAVDHDGSLVRCYERGSDIMWLGKQINTLLWTYTVYTYPDGTENNYYELQNEYSGKYLAPQIDGQVLSDDTIGINMPGRKYGDYYSEIYAWDDPYYSYAGLKADPSTGQLISCPRKDAESFYFAVVDPLDDDLTEVPTIDNNQYGITIKMKDIDKRETMSRFFGDNSGGVGTTLKQGLLSNKLGADGYPTAANDTQNPYGGSNYVYGKSLGTLYQGASTVNHLFLENTYENSGYFEFDSTQNFAQLNDSTNENEEYNFTVYKELGTTDVGTDGTSIQNKPSLKHGQFMPYDKIEAGKYTSVNSRNLYDADQNELPESDPRKYEKLHALQCDNGKPNYYNAMEMSASFIATPDGKDAWGHDIIFEFYGDDDFWLYVDDDLVIDLGGIHSAVPGSVNFSTGVVNENGHTTTLKAIFEDNYRENNPDATQSDIDAYIDSVFVEKNGNYVFKDYTSHTLKIFYMERGAGASNLHMRLNLSYVAPSNVLLTKKLTGDGKDDLDYNVVQYPFKIFYQTTDTSDDTWYELHNETINNMYVEYVNYKISSHHVDFKPTFYSPSQVEEKVYTNVYLLNPGQSAEIRFPVEVRNYKIVECAVNSEVYDSVKINDVTSTGTQVLSSPLYDHESTPSSTEDRPTITFENEVGANKTRTLIITKKLIDENEQPINYPDDETTFNYRLKLSNGSDDYSLSLANMYQYNVKDLNGNYCRWDHENQCFVSIGKSDYQNLLPEELHQVTFETSMNGSISKIPAGYTVEVRDLPVGMMFDVEERTWEIPLGYRFDKYSYDEGTFNLKSNSDDSISGWVKDKENGNPISPKVNVENRRGWEIESEKIWSDKEYVSSHDPIYTAVFLDGVFVEGTLRKITDSSLTARYYFDELAAGKSFTDYKVREVEFTDPVYDNNVDKNIQSYTAISPIEDTIEVNATPKSTGVSETFEYGVTYTQGTPEMTGVNEPAGGNIRRDTILNSRDEGVIISVYDMTSRNENDKVPLEGVPFVLEKYDSVSGDYVEVESLTSDENGKLTILYYDKNTNYRLTQKSSLQGYIGLTEPVIFKIDNDNNISFVGSSEDNWKECDELENQSLTAFVNVYNKPYTLEFYKTNSVPSALAGAHFKLYEGKVNAFGDVVKDSVPMPGCTDLVSPSTGIIPNIDNTLKPGRYFLVETEAPTGYKKVEGDIYFEITELGELILHNVPGGVEDISDSTKIPHEYRVKVVDELDGFKAVTITKKVTGNMGNKVKDFLFTFSIDNPDPAGYSWSKNNEPQDDNLVVSTDPDLNHNTFFLAHDDTVTILVPDGSDVTITEAPLNYTASYSVYPVPDDPNCPPVNGTGVTVTIDDIDKNMKIDYTNELNTLIPTGVFTDFKTLLILSGCLILAILMILIKLRLNHLRNLKRKD